MAAMKKTHQVGGVSVTEEQDPNVITTTWLGANGAEHTLTTKRERNEDGVLEPVSDFVARHVEALNEAQKKLPPAKRGAMGIPVFNSEDQLPDSLKKR